MARPATEAEGAAEQPADWRIRPARGEDEAAVLALYRESFGRDRSGADWRWKLLARAGRAEMVWVAETGVGELIGHHAGIPLRFSMAGEEVDAVQSVEAMTSPRHRRRGLLLALGKGLYDSWSEAGVAFILGMPNERWGSRARAIGFVPFARLQWLKLVLRPSRALEGRLPPPIAALLRPLDPLARRLPSLLARPEQATGVREVREAGPEIDLLWQRAAPGYREDYLLVRSAGYVQWRFLDCPVPYRVLLAEDEGGPAGYAAFRVTEAEGRRVGWLADLFAPGDARAVWRALLRRAVERMREDGADSIAALAGPGSALHRQLRGAGFLAGRHEFEVSMVPGAWPGCEAAMREPERWQLAGANFDVI